MKKLTKILMLLLVACCAFVFTACGKGELDTEVKVNTGNEADYVACTIDNSFASKLEVGEIVTPAEADVLKMTFKANMDMTQGGTPVQVALDMNLMLTVDAESTTEIKAEDIGMAAKGTVTVSSIMFDDAVKMDISAYVKEGVVYVAYAAGGQEVKGKMTMGEQQPGIETPNLNIEQIKEMLNSILQSNNLIQKVLTNGETSTYKLEFGTTKIYVVVENGEFSKALVTMKDVNFVELVAEFIPELAEDEIPQITFDEIYVAVEFTDSEIKYPSFNGYQEITNGLIPGM